MSGSGPKSPESARIPLGAQLPPEFVGPLNEALDPNKARFYNYARANFEVDEQTGQIFIAVDDLPGLLEAVKREEGYLSQLPPAERVFAQWESRVYMYQIETILKQLEQALAEIPGSTREAIAPGDPDYENLRGESDAGTTDGQIIEDPAYGDTQHYHRRYVFSDERRVVLNGYNQLNYGSSLDLDVEEMYHEYGDPPDECRLTLIGDPAITPVLPAIASEDLQVGRTPSPKILPVLRRIVDEMNTVVDSGGFSFKLPDYDNFIDAAGRVYTPNRFSIDSHLWMSGGLKLDEDGRVQFVLTPETAQAATANLNRVVAAREENDAHAAMLKRADELEAAGRGLEAVMLRAGKPFSESGILYVSPKVREILERFVANQPDIVIHRRGGKEVRYDLAGGQTVLVDEDILRLVATESLG